MGFLEELRAAYTTGGTAITVGVFDGVHRGHQHLIKRLLGLAEPDLSACLITFSNHPSTVLSPGPPYLYLTTLQERIEMLRQTGVDHVVPMEFTYQVSQMSYREFAQALVESVNLKRLLVGPDFAMGKAREGTGPALASLGKEMGFNVSVAEPLVWEGATVSSSTVRQWVEVGDVRGAGQLLGRPYSLDGIVVRGESRGRALGFPTANIDVPAEVLVPANGVYSTVAMVRGHSWPSVTSIGVRPTFGGGQRTVETYIMDFSGDLYGLSLKVELQQRIRDEQRFDSVSGLIAQMHEDVATARRLLSPFTGNA